jgi:hypothetical protein
MTYDGPIPIATGTTSPVVRGSPLWPTGLTTVTTPLNGAVLQASGSAFLGERPFLPTEASDGLRYPVRQPVFVRKIVSVGGYETLDMIAGQTLSGHRLVTVSGGEVVYASRDDLSTFQGVLGLTLGAADEGEIVQVRTGGEITEPSWSWTSGADIYLDTSGQLTQTVPPDEPNTYFLRVGVAINATTISLDIEDPILF